MARDIAIAAPRFVLGRPPTPEGITAGEIVGIHHPPMVECPFVVAPATLAVFRWPKIATGLADAFDPGRSWDGPLVLNVRTVQGNILGFGKWL